MGSWSSTPSGYEHPQAPLPGYGPAPSGGPLPGGSGRPPSSNTGLKLGLGIAAALLIGLLVLGVFAYRWLSTGFETFSSAVEVGLDAGTEPGFSYGDNAVLDQLYDGCADGEFTSCDRLYVLSELDSQYEAFGDSCGNRNDPAGWCEDIYGR